MDFYLKLIKKYYGQKMMHLCRELFPTILEVDGKLFEILSSKFYYNKFLYDDIVDNYFVNIFRDHIYNIYVASNDNTNEECMSNKSPYELLDEAGYVLYECKTEKDIQYFKKYYAKGEELCTFNGGRLNHCYVFLLLKKMLMILKEKTLFILEEKMNMVLQLLVFSFQEGLIIFYLLRIGIIIQYITVMLLLAII